MNLAVLLYADDYNPDSLPGVWPSRVVELGDGTSLPGENWQLMTLAEFEAYKVTHLAEYNEYLASLV